ncbi:glycosyltransferase family 39 protein [Rhodoplanes azumiensis]|uniref:Glycosyltransferase family 39 protein n=1 Tax=Rhodoplanes azumiensis TaxID=1897628 RepID=A0ABW5AQS7_9BRAD
MLHVSLFVELLRADPRLVVWAAALVQATLWWLVPTLFYAAPPGNLPLIIAVGHEFQLGSYWGPPLASWLAEIAFAIAGTPGVYLLSQACVVATYWGVFALGRAIVGAQHAAMAVLVMVGIAVLTVPTPDFGPPILAMPLTVFVLRHYWRVIGEGRRSAWYVMAIGLALLLLTMYAGLILIAAIAVFTVASRRGREMLLGIEPWVALFLIGVIVLPHFLWIDMSGVWGVWTGAPGGAIEPLEKLGQLLAGLVLAHLGVGLLYLIAVGPTPPKEKSPTFTRKPLTGLERHFVLFFAAALPLGAIVAGAFMGDRGPIGGLGPYVVLSGLAIVVLAGNTIVLQRQGLTSLAWTLLLVAPPAIAAASVAVLPFVSKTDVPIGQPAAAIGEFFGDRFERRTGKPLAIVAGEPRLASLVAIAAPSRPSFYFDAAPDRTPWVTGEELRRKGAIVLWPTTGTSTTVPPDIKARFPDLVAEVPQTFTRTIQGRLPLMRIGWGMLRPQ